MGEVYRARDSRLGRDVALKVLPVAFAADAERMARFQREAQVLASLNHPNIASIYGLEDSGKVRALVMELVEGPTLADRLTKGAIPVDEVLSLAKQICEAVEYAHERGIVHRDLKPANIKLANSSSVKILDFGLAKALEGDEVLSDISSSPTITRLATQQGIILGTAAYMSPEQAKGKSVDRRADIWSFGCVLFEMLTRKMAFSGETVTDTLAAVIKEEPYWSSIPEAAPPRICELLRRCLKKDPRQRLQSIGDARITIEEALSGASPDSSSWTPAPAPIPSPLWRRVLPWALAAALVVIASFLAVAYFHRSAATPQSLRLTIAPPRDAQLGSAFALSPDGTRLVFVATSSGKQMLWMRPLDSLQAQPVPGTEQGDFPFWSPDGKSIGFFASGKLKRLDLDNGSIQNLCGMGTSRGGAWSADGTIVFTPEVNSVLMKIPATGGTPVPATVFDPARQERSDRWPFFLPDGRHFVFLEEGKGNEQSPDAVAVGSLDSTKTQVLVTLPTGSAAIYADGYLVYSSGGSLVAQSFSTDHLRFTGNPVRLAENISPIGILGPTGYLSASASATGILVYRNDVSTISQLTLVDRSGNTIRTIGPPGRYNEPALSPDQKKIAVSMPDPNVPGAYALWLVDVASSAFTRFTFDTFGNGSATWSHDGRWIYFNSDRNGVYNIYRKRADGSGDAELVLKSVNIDSPSDISKDDRFLLYIEYSPVTGQDLLFLPLNPGGKPEAFAMTSAAEMNGRFSPDGRFVVYCSDENHPGDFEVFVSSFPPSSSKWQVSSSGGYWPLWSADGREIYFISGTTMMATDVIPGPTFQFRPPRPLFSIRPAESFLGATHVDYSVYPSRQQFLLNQLVNTGESPPITVVANWTAELKRK